MTMTIPSVQQKSMSAEQAAVFERIASLSEELIATLTEKKSLTGALRMTDSELAKLIFETQLGRASEISPREKRRIAHLNDSAIRFTERLKALGGTCRATEAATLLGVKRQTVNNRLKANKLLAVQFGGEYKFPLFQFDGNRLVAGLEEILLILGDISAISKTSFLTATYFFANEKDLNAIDALKQYGSRGEHMDEIRRQATLFGSQAAH